MSEKKDFNSLRQQCCAQGKLYKDPEFQPSDHILLAKKKRNVQWFRPFQICANPQFVVDGFSRFDVRQGEIGDCWFLAAVATLTQNQKLFEQVVPKDNDFEKNYAGIFHFR